MLVYSISMFLVSALFTVLGIAIYKGKTDLIHDYDQTKVTDKSAYGKAFGKAMLLIATVMLLSGIIGLFEKFEMHIPNFIVSKRVYDFLAERYPRMNFEPIFLRT